MRFMMRRRRTSTPRNWCSGSRGRSRARPCKTAVHALLARHASLRAGFQHENLSRPVQIIVPAGWPPWHSIDLSLLDEAARAERLDGILTQDRAERFDLASPPLMRFTLIRLAAASASAACSPAITS